MIPHEYIEELTRRTDIVELVGSYVQLKRKGRLYGGLCLFHSENRPPLRLPDTQSLLPAGAGGGDAITFCQKDQQHRLPEAVKMLAHSGRDVPEPQEMTRPAGFAQPHPVHEQGAPVFPCLPQLHRGGGPGRPVPTGGGGAG